MLENRKVEKQLKEEAKRKEFAEKVVKDVLSDQEEIQDISVKGSVTCELLNIRKEPDTGAEVLTVIPKDSIVTICDTNPSPDFYKVLIGNLEGYCMKKFMTIIE